MELLTALDLIAEKAQTYSMETLRPDALKEEMKTFHVCVVMAGAFSAGKSALLNALMGGDILKEGQRPETAIASELLYDEEEYVEAVSGDNVTRFDVTQAGDLDVRKFDYLKWHLHNAGLRGIRDYTLVDMPGFNSGIQAHNKAILRYADKACAYILVIDVEDGGIKRSLEDFIHEIRNYGENLSIIVSKCDIKTPDEVETVVSGVRSSAESLFGEEIPVVATSKFDSDAGKILSGVVRGFDRQKLFSQRFRPMVLAMGQEVISVLTVLKKNQRLNISDLNEEIEKRERGKQMIAKELERERQKLKDRFEGETLSAIMEDARSALTAQAASLATSLQSGGVDFSARVNAILRPVLLASTRRYTEENFDALISGLEISSESEENIEQGLLYGMRKSSELVAMMSDSADKYGGVYKAVTGVLAVTTTFIAPWLEVLVFFLPDILKLFSGMARQNRQEELEHRVRSEVIPQIINNLTPEVSRSLREIEDQMVEELEEQMSRQMELEADALKGLKEQLQTRKEQHSQEVQKIERDIAEIQAAMQDI